MPVTLQDIADATGYDKSTVSVALRDLPRAKRFSAETRERIQGVARKLGYRPNFFARQLSDKKPRLLMLCLNYLRDPFAMMVAEGFERHAGERGYRVLISALHDHEDPFVLQRDILGVQGVPAMALVGGASSKLSEQSLVQLADEGVRIVLVNRTVADKRIAHVGVNDYDGGVAVARHIYGQRLREVWILGGMESEAVEARQRAFADVAKSAGAPKPKSLRCRGMDWAGSAAEVVANELKKSERRPEAILAASDVLALGAGRSLSEAGLVVGRDVALTGFDDGIYAQCAWPPLTSVRIPMVEMGRAAVDQLIEMLVHPEEPARNVVLPVELMVRQSSKLAASGRSPSTP